MLFRVGNSKAAFPRQLTFTKGEKGCGKVLSNLFPPVTVYMAIYIGNIQPNVK
jgi:hypothetical protein